MINIIFRRGPSWIISRHRISYTFRHLDNLFHTFIQLINGSLRAHLRALKLLVHMISEVIQACGSGSSHIFVRNRHLLVRLRHLLDHLHNGGLVFLNLDQDGSKPTESLRKIRVPETSAVYLKRHWESNHLEESTAVVAVDRLSSELLLASLALVDALAPLPTLDLGDLGGPDTGPDDPD